MRVREQDPADALEHRRADDRVDVPAEIGPGIDHRDLVDADEIGVRARPGHQTRDCSRRLGARAARARSATSGVRSGTGPRAARRAARRRDRSARATSRLRCVGRIRSISPSANACSTSAGRIHADATSSLPSCSPSWPSGAARRRSACRSDAARPPGVIQRANSTSSRASIGMPHSSRHSRAAAARNSSTPSSRRDRSVDRVDRAAREHGRAGREIERRIPAQDEDVQLGAVAHEDHRGGIADRLHGGSLRGPVTCPVWTPTEVRTRAAGFPASSASSPSSIRRCRTPCAPTSPREAVDAARRGDDHTRRCDARRAGAGTPHRARVCSDRS